MKTLPDPVVLIYIPVPWAKSPAEVRLSRFAASLIVLGATLTAIVYLLAA